MCADFSFEEYILLLKREQRGGARSRGGVEECYQDLRCYPQEFLDSVSPSGLPPTNQLQLAVRGGFLWPSYTCGTAA